MVQRKRHTAEFKTKVAIEALKEQKTVNQISSHFEVHSGQVSQWKRLAKDILLEGFQGSAGRQKRGKEIISQEELYSQIGQLKVELDWIKKKSGIER